MRSGAVQARTKRGRANDELILDAAMVASHSLGIDAIGLKDVAAAAGLTTGALYGRYEGVGELQADLWRERLLPALASLLTDVRAAIDEDFTDESVERAMNPSPDRTLATFACGISPRAEELGDLVPDDVTAELRAHQLLPSEASAFELGFLGLILGVHLHAQREGGGQVSPTECASLLRAAPRTLSGIRPRVVLPAEPRFSVPNDPTREGLVNALARVVARSGLHRATVRRIARAAGSSHTAVYSRYEGIHELVTDFVQVVGQSSPAPAVVAERYLNLELLTAHLLGGLQPEAKALRRLSIEFLVGVSPNPELAALVNKYDENRYAESALTFCRRQSEQYRAFQSFARAIRAINFGAMLLEDVVGGLPELDFRPVVSALNKSFTS